MHTRLQTAWKKSSPALIARFEEALPRDPRVTPRKMFGYPAAFVGGHMTTGLFEDRWFVRLGADDRAELMALAGADVVLLPAGGASPEAAAREAKVPLLLQGTVSKLGKGYSVDTTVTDLETGKTAGAFFAAAATEDDIIAQLGVLSGEISEKLFGVQGAIRATACSPAHLHPDAVAAADELRAKAIVRATTHFRDPKILAEVSAELGEAMPGLEIGKIGAENLLQTRGW